MRTRKRKNKAVEALEALAFLGLLVVGAYFFSSRLHRPPSLNVLPPEIDVHLWKKYNFSQGGLVSRCAHRVWRMDRKTTRQVSEGGLSYIKSLSYPAHLQGEPVFSQDKNWMGSDLCQLGGSVPRNGFPPAYLWLWDQKIAGRPVYVAQISSGDRGVQYRFYPETGHIMYLSTSEH